jgi:hypothetical protein
MKKILMILGVITFFLCFSNYVSAQSPIIMSNTKCEENASIFESATSNAKKDSSIIAIARLGKSEKSPVYNLKRLKVIKDYLSYTKFSKSLVTAQGESMKVNGRVEIYVNGTLALIFEVLAKRSLQVGNCGY